MAGDIFRCRRFFLVTHISTITRLPNTLYLPLAIFALPLSLEWIEGAYQIPHPLDCGIQCCSCSCGSCSTRWSQSTLQCTIFPAIESASFIRTIQQRCSRRVADGEPEYGDEGNPPAMTDSFHSERGRETTGKRVSWSIDVTETEQLVLEQPQQLSKFFPLTLALIST